MKKKTVKAEPTETSSLSSFPLLIFSLSRNQLMHPLQKSLPALTVHGGASTTATLEAFLFSVPSIISPKFKDKDTTTAVNALARACLIATQWKITEDKLNEMEQ
jgi:hypothetical protein